MSNLAVHGEGNFTFTVEQRLRERVHRDRECARPLGVARAVVFGSRHYRDLSGVGESYFSDSVGVAEKARGAGPSLPPYGYG